MVIPNHHGPAARVKSPAKQHRLTNASSFSANASSDVLRGTEQRILAGCFSSLARNAARPQRHSRPLGRPDHAAPQADPLAIQPNAANAPLDARAQRRRNTCSRNRESGRDLHPGNAADRGSAPVGAPRAFVTSSLSMLGNRSSSSANLCCRSSSILAAPSGPITRQLDAGHKRYSTNEAFEPHCSWIGAAPVRRRIG
ncbi:hypothetical protein FQR65_LT20831 [Abscondita terminalis]|nr:hypothetical protein FQR65_LT20831 [Abscondita terminalis]